MSLALSLPHTDLKGWPPASEVSGVALARTRHGKPFAHELGNWHTHTIGPAYWTVERIASLASQNDQYRKRKTP